MLNRHKGTGYFMCVSNVKVKPSLRSRSVGSREAIFLHLVELGKRSLHAIAYTLASVRDDAEIISSKAVI